jgi:hypothetical protein
MTQTATGVAEQGPDAVDAAVASALAARGNSVGRYVTALGLIAVVGLSFARETRGEPMPSDPSIQLTEKSQS